jgi:type IV pilus assembly protein PilM
MANLPEFVGINIGNYSMKALELKFSGANNIELSTLGKVPSATGTIENISVGSIDAPLADLQKLIKETGFKTKNVVFSVPESLVFSRLITIPKVKDEEVDNAINFAMRNLIPVPLENLNIAYVFIEERKTDTNTFTSWYVVGIQKSLSDRFKELAQRAGLNLLAIETEAVAIVRNINYNYADTVKKNFLVLDLGGEYSNLIISRNGAVLYSQNISTGSNALTKIIATDLSVDIAQAEVYKEKIGLDFSMGEGKVSKTIEPIVQIIVSEIIRTVSYYNDRIGGEPLGDLYITGGGGALPKLAEYLSEKTNLKVSLVENFKKIKVKGELKTNQLSFNVATGLALKNLELI